MAGTKLDLAVSGSSSATSGIGGDVNFGDTIAGAMKIPIWVWLGALGVVLVVSVAWILRK